MADVRALLKAKRQEARISHPLASYSQSGQLRCVACGPVKHASAWEGHLGSKLHRTTVARFKEEERLREAQRISKEEEEQARVLNGKRKAEEQDSEESDTESKRRKVDDASTSSGFPADFFSDPSRAPLPPQSDDEEDDPPPAAAPIDSEWERFQRDVVNAPDPRDRDTYENATVMAEPELASETPEGFPPQQTEDAPDEPSKLDVEEARRRKEHDERELIMDRLLDEERAQEEADMKVTLMKNRLDALMRKRNAAKAAKLKAPT